MAPVYAPGFKSYFTGAGYRVMLQSQNSSEKSIIPWCARGFTASWMFVGAALIIIIASNAYFPTLKNGFVCDDDICLIYNKNVKSPDGLRIFWCGAKAMDYWPLFYSSFWIEWRLWEMKAIGYHATNLILHIAESLLIWIILRKLAVPGAFLAALIFAVHPVNVESVAWISQRKNLMAMLFFLLSILCYVRHIELARLRLAAKQIPHPSSLIPHRSFLSAWYWLSLAGFVCAMLGKVSAVVLPVVLLGVLWSKRSDKAAAVSDTGKTASRPFMREELINTGPFFLVAVVFAALNVWFQSHNTIAVIRNAGFLERLLGAGYVIWFYLYKAVLPVNLAMIYPQLRIEAASPLCWLPLGAALAVTFVLCVYRKTWARPFLPAWAFFCLALTPVMGFWDTLFMQISLVADHYQHIALIAVAALASAGFSVWIVRMRAAPRSAAIGAAALAVVLLALATWRQSALYRDNFTIARDTLDKNPECWMAQYNLGVATARAGSPAEAIEYFRKALEGYPEFADANYNMADALLELGLLREAAEQYLRVLQVRPDHAAAHYNLANVLLQMGRNRDAIEHFRRAIACEPDFAEAYYNLANVFSETGQHQEAIEYYKDALRLKPDDFDIHNNLGIVLAQAGAAEEAVEHLQKAVQLKPDFETHYNLGLALARAGRWPEAIEHYQMAVRLAPDSCAAYVSLMSAYAGWGRGADAVGAAQKALQLARAQGQTALAREIEEWLQSHTAEPSRRPPATP